MAEALTIALILEARDNASEWIDRVRANVDKLKVQAEEASKAVASSADEMTASLERTDAASTSAADGMDREALATDRATAATRDQALAADETTAATDRNTEATLESSKATEEATAKSDLFTKATNAIGLAMIGVGVVAAKLAITFQSETASLASHAGISTAAANKIGNAFLSTGGKVTFSANQMMTAFSPVAGEFVNMTGHALNVKQSMTFMNAAMQLAEASGGDLTITTKALADAMMVFHLKVNQAASAGNMMWNTSRLLGVSTDSLAQSLARLEPRIAGSGMSLAQVTGFMVELSKSAGGGRQAMRIAGQAIQQLVAPSSTAQKSLAELGVTLTTSSGKFIGVTAAIAKIHAALARLPGVTKDVVAMQKAYRLQTQLSTLGLQPQTKALKSQESVLSTQISALNQSTKSLSKNSMMQALFGRQAGLMTSIVLGGVPAFDKYIKSVTKSGEVASAAAKQDATFHAMLEKLKSAAEDLFIKLGQKLLPVLVKLAEKTLTITNHIIDWVEHNQTLTKVIAGVVIGVLALIKVIALVRAATEAWVVVQTALDVAMDANPIGVVLLAILALAAAAAYLTIHWRQVGEVFVAVWHGIEDLLNGSASFILNHVTIPIMHAFGAAWTSISNAAATSWHAVVRVWKDASSWFVATVTHPIAVAFNASWKVISTVVLDVWHAISDAASATWHAIVSVWDTVSSWFTNNVSQPVGAAFSTLWSAISGAASATWHAIVSVWDTVSSWFDAHVIQPIENLFRMLWRGIITGVHHVVSMITSAFSGISSVFSSVFGPIGSALGIIGLAEGGLVTSPTLAVVGESGPEMVVPLSKVPGGAQALNGGVTALPSMRGGTSSGTVIQVNLTMAGQVYGDINQALNAMGRQLATVLVPGAGTRLTTR